MCALANTSPFVRIDAHIEITSITHRPILIVTRSLLLFSFVFKQFFGFLVLQSLISLSRWFRDGEKNAFSVCLCIQHEVCSVCSAFMCRSWKKNTALGAGRLACDRCKRLRSIAWFRSELNRWISSWIACDSPCRCILFTVVLGRRATDSLMLCLAFTSVLDVHIYVCLISQTNCTAYFIIGEAKQYARVFFLCVEWNVEF